MSDSRTYFVAQKIFIRKLFGSLGEGLVEEGVGVMKTKRGKTEELWGWGNVYGNLVLGSSMGLMIVAEHEKYIYLCGTLLGFLLTL